MSTPQHCPGYENFSDEFQKDHTCAKCGKPIDFTQCTLDGGA
jgi:hypothetical protein